MNGLCYRFATCDPCFLTFLIVIAFAGKVFLTEHIFLGYFVYVGWSS